MGKIQTILDMTLGHQMNGVEPTVAVNGQIPPIIEEDGEDDGILEIAAKKNRQRFAINKSYSIEVKIIPLLLSKLFNAFQYRTDTKERPEISSMTLSLKPKLTRRTRKIGSNWLDNKLKV